MFEGEMGEKLQRVFRDRRLTPEELAADEKVREQIAAEFPPSEPSGGVGTQMLSDLLRRAIRDSGRSLGELARDAGLPEALLARFLAGERDIHMTTADRLAALLELEVTARS
jgi:hypothetical protein